MNASYFDACGVVRERIASLVERHPAILQMKDAAELHGIAEFDVSDIDPSGAMVQAALESVQGG